MQHETGSSELMTLKEHISEIEVRRRQLEELEAMGINPYPSKEFPITHTTTEILSGFERNPEAFSSVSIAGRLMNRRIMGKASFAVLQDERGRIQLYFNRDELCPGEDKTLYNKVFKKLIARGDIIGVRGNVFKTKTGEITLNVKEFVLLAKSLLPLPLPKEKDGKVWDAFTDPEQRYRMRYVDLIVNPHVREIFRKRSQLVQSLRNFFIARNFLEVETPILQPLYGGANARPFVTYHNTLGMRLYLRISNELYLKRLIVGGFEGVFEFSKDFRNEGISRYHNPEFTQVELYAAYKDYKWMMNFVEEALEKAVLEIHGKTRIPVGENEIDFARPWKRMTFYGAIEEYTGVKVSDKSFEELKEIFKDKIDTEGLVSKAMILDELFGEFVEKNLIQPTIITDYPTEMSPLAKQHADNPELTERFEVICNGKEIANAFSELNDPREQRRRFEEQLQMRELGDEEAMLLDEDFLRALEYGMPPTAGIGIGIDRLAMIITNSPSIQEVLFFPQMKPEKKQRKISKALKEIVGEKFSELLAEIDILNPSDLLNIEPKQLMEKLRHRSKEIISLQTVKNWVKQAKNI